MHSTNSHGEIEYPKFKEIMNVFQLEIQNMDMILNSEPSMPLGDSNPILIPKMFNERDDQEDSCILDDEVYALGLLFDEEV